MLALNRREADASQLGVLISDLKIQIRTFSPPVMWFIVSVSLIGQAMNLRELGGRVL
jgi:hypothetical protein